jgi:hypothetical protein
LKNYPRTIIQSSDDLVFVPISEETLRQHLVQKVKAESLKELTLRQRKKYAGKPIYLVRYE